MLGNTRPRSIIITGALRGLGFELSKKLVQEAEYQLIVTSRDQERSQPALIQLMQINPQCVIHYHVLDISNLQSIKQFSLWVSQLFGKFDILVNNAAIIDIQFKESSLEEQARIVMETNLYGTMKVTETLLPFLSEDGKILLISSEDGRLIRQEASIRETLNEFVSKDQIIEMSEQFIQMIKNNKLMGWIQYPNTSYGASKVLLNAYGRWVVTQLIGADQSVYIIDPGWCKTDMGTDDAPLQPKGGIRCMLYLIQDVPFGRNENLNGKYFTPLGGLYTEF